MRLFSIAGVCFIFALLVNRFTAVAMEFDLKGDIQLQSAYVANPSEPLLFPHEDDSSNMSVLRAIMNAKLSEKWSFEINYFASLTHSSLQGLFVGNVPQNADANDYQDPSMTWNFKKQELSSDQFAGSSAFDRLLLQYSGERLQITAGRQAINLATCFFLTPNDFFHPFSAQAYDRIYKPGVDALQASVSLSDLAHIDLIGAAGYKGYELNWQESAALVRAVATVNGFELAVGAGKTAERNVILASLQGEIGLLGVRSEANYSFPDKHQTPYLQLAAGLDHRFENSLHLFLEYMFRGNGISQASGYLNEIITRTSGSMLYLGKNYAIFAVEYEFYPLLNGTISALTNLIDPSTMFSAYLRYSLSNEADFIAGGALPAGKAPQTFFIGALPFPDIKSEFGTSPKSIFAELRFFF
jgi:hypothetical protein